ncbi:hypothetical protein U0039_00175 [Stenotrophomonas maltophilia]|uniref:Uncharacterized protein n=2 Tax=Stenotrophomonas maltophilia TaxID=40324 RepID=B2FU25_STRMK|nr:MULTISPECIES: hypothetical protein [Stenotrophomonas]OMP41074.1 hypothetical protein BMR86_03740 [Stenotrophomonas sp. KAs 5-3]AIL10188.1 hypothetical protein DP16_3657 [Stenotrophomonas maltophilia]KOO77105.1 hypothetical protein VO93_00170 [Stenotrophomonas maltophilia]KOO83318.1 hypothetical protein VL23_08850 [Stenotrophomonas maltophilia]MBH1518475.1 hypothetical protein [Stenotrophomonas maltophilia]
MNTETVRVSGVPGVADGVLSATITDTWFDAERTAHIVEVARRIERLHSKASRRLAIVSGELDEALEGHPLEDRLRERLLWPLERDCLELATVAARVRVRLSLFAPAQSQEQFDRGMALQLADLQAEQAAVEPPQERAPSAAPMPYGYWISEDSFNRVERARSASLLLSSVGEGIGESVALSFDAVAASAAYVHEDLAAVVASARHSSQMEADDDAA